MKKLIIALGLTLSLSSLFAANNLPTPHGSTESLNSIAAIVNKDVITSTQLNNAIEQTTKRLESQHVNMPADTVIRAQVLKQLIYQSLQEQIAKRANITISITDVSKAIANIAARNKTTVAGLYKKVHAEAGLTESAFKAQIKQQMLISRVQQEAVGGEVNVSPKEVDAAYAKALQQADSSAEYLVGDILVSLPSSPTSAQLQSAESKAALVAKKLRAGNSFATVSRQYSDSQDALKGGELPWSKLSGLPEIFAQRLANMKTGDISGPFRAPNGFHIIKLVSMRNGAQTQVTKTSVRDALLQRQFADKLQTWLQQLHDSAYIKILQP